MNRAQFGSISSSDLIDAKLEEHQLRGSKRCPSCSHELEGKPNWVGLPAGVKFDPTDQELIDHLEAKVEAKGSKSHPLIDEFIPTIEGDDGICYTHPEKLPGVTRDGLSKHFFHRPSKAYTTGTRKRRKIQTECDFQGSETRWHKTGKTRPVMVAGIQKGCKKILVLYTNFGKNRKPEKTNWVMHQYHLGKNEEEREGELVVSKIFYQTQPRQCNWAEKGGAATGDGGGGRESFSYKELVGKRDEMCGGVDSNIGGAISSYGGMGFEQLRTEHFGFAPPRKNFDEVNEAVVSEPSTLREASAAAGTCEERDMNEHQRPDHVTHIEHQHQQHLVQQPHQVATSAEVFHNISMPSNPISTIISPPPLHHTSIILDEDNSFHISRVMLQNENFQQQQHHKMGGRSASGLEELIMSYTSTDHIKDESSIRNSQDPEWLKYTFWPDPDIPNHHG